MPKKKSEPEERRIAIARVRGNVNIRGNIKDTLRMLNLTRVNHCTLLSNEKSQIGMIRKIKDYVTWGEIADNVMEDLLRKRGMLKGNKRVTDSYIKKNSNFKSIQDFSNKFINFKAELKDIPGLKPVFRLNPPSKGYERGGIKHPFSTGGALGYRGEKINDLLKRMI